MRRYICLSGFHPLRRDRVYTDSRCIFSQVTIEIDTNLPKKEPKEPKKEVASKGIDKENGDDSETRPVFEFKLPVELLA
jgi:D-aminoacyl-tRNA deacylase